MKAIFFDIDGTLIPRGEKRIPASTITALHKCRQKGILLFIATGRPVDELQMLTSDFSFDGFCALNGQYCCIGNQCIREEALAIADLRNAVCYFNKNEIACMFAEKDYTYINAVSDELVDFKKETGGKLNSEDTPNRIEKYDTFQVMPFLNMTKEKELMRYMPNAKSLRWHPSYTDIIPKNGGKDKGIQTVLSTLGIEKRDAMAFGDGQNDIDMFQVVGMSIAMGNSPEEVKGAAQFVTNTVDMDGVAAALRKYLYIG